MKKIEHDAKDAVVSQDIAGREVEEDARSDRIMKPNAVFVRVPVYHHVQVKLVEVRLLQSRERLPAGEEESVPSRHGLWCARCDEADSTVECYNTNDMRWDRA